MPRVHGELVALLDDSPCLVELRQVEAGIDALGEEVERERDEVDVAGPLAVAEERPLDALRARHQSQLRGRYRRAPVVVRMDGQDGGVAPREVPCEPFDAVGVDVRREVLDRRRQVDDHGIRRRRHPFAGDGFADLERVLELRVVEALGRVLEADGPARGVGEPPAHLGAADGELRDPGLVEPEDDAPLRGGGRVVEMDDRVLRARDRLEGPLDELRTRLRQHGDRHAVGNQLLLDERAHEVEVGLGRGGEPDLDLLEAEVEQQREEPALAVRVHRVDEGLVAVAEVGRAPDRRRRQNGVGPRPVGEVDGGVRRVLVEWHRHGAAPEGAVVLQNGDGYVRRQASPSGEGGGRSGGPSTRARPQRYAILGVQEAEKRTKAFTRAPARTRRSPARRAA